MPDQVHQLSVDELQPNPLQPRGVITPDSLMDLVESIKEHGVLEPLVVAETPAGYQIIAGERRWRAAKLAASFPNLTSPPPKLPTESVNPPLSCLIPFASLPCPTPSKTVCYRA